MDGKRVIMLGSNNYLGLATHPKLIKAAMDAVERYGTSMTGSRLLNGSTKIHEHLEELLADFFGAEACLTFTTGYQANLGTISALVNKRAAVVIDRAWPRKRFIVRGFRLSGLRMNDAQPTLAAVRRHGNSFKYCRSHQ